LSKPIRPAASHVSSRPNARQLAWVILQQWAPHSWFAEDRIEHEASKHFLSGPDRGMLNTMVLCALRNRSLLDAWVDHLRGPGRLDGATRHLLQLGLAQLLLLNMASHAAVNETVNLASPASRGLVNAILRRAGREAAELHAFAQTLPWHVRSSIPEFLAKKWRNNFGATQAEDLAKWINEPAPILVRANELKFRSFAKIGDVPGTTPLEAHPGFFQCADLPSRLLQDGVVYAQDPSTALAPRLLAPAPGQTILDACAAPGGKTALMAQLMGNKGKIIAADNSAKRLKRLEGNLFRLGVKNATLLEQDWIAKEAPSWLHSVDGILIDAPCSNTGVMRRRVDVRWRLTPETAGEMQQIQLKLLTALAPLVKVGGRIVYSTCSIEPEENEGAVQKFTQANPNYILAETDRSLPFRDKIDGGFAALLIRKS
jgi:16S rRNA (cytosine967-C5)-methyltransferase